MEQDFIIKDGVLEKYEGKETNVTIPAGVTVIGDSAFTDCKNLKKVTISEGVTSIGIRDERNWRDGAFRGCSSLKEVIIPEGVTVIGDLAFYGCSSLEEVRIPEGVTEIGRDAFRNCSSLKEVNIPSGVTVIGDRAFYGCSSLEKVRIPEGVRRIEWGAFSGCSSLKELVIPEEAMDCAFFKKRIFEKITFLADVGLETDGSKKYDLGNQTAVVRMQEDLSFIVELPESGKTAKSLPKRGADPLKYEVANKDFTNMKKRVKKIIKARKKFLFEDFLDKKYRTADSWKEDYLKNPVLRLTGRLLVWKQEETLFTVCGDKAADVCGQEVILGEAPVFLAHPMEMSEEEVREWQEYFLNNGIKQPFAQMWEPVRKAEEIKTDRYKGCMIPYYRFSGQEKHGIYVEDYNFHAFIDIEFEGCMAEVEWIDGKPHKLEYTDPFEVRSFSFSEYTRRVNHIVAYLDRVTVLEKINKDDVTIAESIKEFTLAQILECIDKAMENQSTNCLALLLEEKNRRWPDCGEWDSLLLEE